MTNFICGLTIGFLGGAICAFLYMMVQMARRSAAPTMHHRRKYRDAEIVATVPVWERQEVGGIRYEHLGMAGEEV